MRLRPLLVTIAVVGALTGRVFAQQTEGQVRVLNAWARATPGASKIGAVYATLESPSGDRLVSVGSPVAAAAELHEHRIDDKGVMTMRELAGLDLPPGQAVALKPNGYHVMLIDLRQKLVAGQSFPVTFTFEKAGKVETNVMIAGPGASGPPIDTVPSNQATKP
jgi:copper(I)-binding protein